MYRTRVGYAGGTAADPTYQRIGDHTEALQVDFDPEVISYTDLLDLFWTSHDPSRSSYSMQYKSMILAADESQLSAARASRDRFEVRLGRPILTEIRLLDRFYRAEDYHQKYRLRADSALMREFGAIFVDDRAFVDSTAAARANGYLDGTGDTTGFEHDIDRLGLSEKGRERLARSVRPSRLR